MPRAAAAHARAEARHLRAEARGVRRQARADRQASRDRETRARLVDTAAALFADRGFKKVTVREICRAARANVAAVNYHFGDKAGLYREVVMTAIEAMKETNELSQRAAAAAAPERQLRQFVRVFLERLTGSGRRAWIHKLMAREMEEPSEALDLVVRQVVQPRLDYLGAIVGAIAGLPPADPRVLLSVVSLQAQCLMLARPVPAPMRRLWEGVAPDLDATADHISSFSLAGIRALSAQPAR